MDIGQLIKDPLGTIGGLLTSLLTGIGLAPQAVSVILMIIGVVMIASVALVLPLFLIWFERRVVARMQDRMGPNRVGPQGLLQTIADAIKLMIKEDITPTGADKLVYNAAPILSDVALSMAPTRSQPSAADRTSAARSHAADSALIARSFADEP